MNGYLEDRKNKIEIYVGGALAVIAIVAAISRAIVAGVSIETFLDMVINVAGLGVSALVMFVAIRSIVTNSPKNLKQELESALGHWEDGNRPLVFKVSDFDATGKYQLRYAILARQTDFLELPKTLSSEMEARLTSKNSKASGKFVSLPSIDQMVKNGFVMEFHLIDSSYSGDMKELVGRTVKCILLRFPGVKITQKGSNDFDVEHEVIATRDDVRALVAFINFVLTLLLIQA